MITKEALLKTGYFVDNKYLDMYVDLVYKNRNTSYVRNVTNNHHIIPKSYYKRLEIPIDNSSNNIVTLLFKDHVVAHYYLYLCSSNNEDKYANFCALRHLYGLSKRRNIEFNINALNLDKLQQMCEESRKHFSQMMRGKFLGDNNPSRKPGVGKKISDARKGHPVSNYTRRLISEKNKGQHRSPYNYTLEGYTRLSTTKLGANNPMKNPESVEKMRKSVTGLRRVTNGIENKTIKPELLQEYIDKGFWVGVTFKTKPGKKT